MSLELNFISALLQYKDLKKVYERGVNEDLLGGPELQLWKFIEEFNKSYGSLPSKDRIKEEFQIDLPEVTDPLDYFIDELSKKKTFHDLQEMVVDVDRKLGESKTAEALEKVREVLKEQEKKNYNVSIKNIFSFGDKVKQRYIDAQKGKVGIPTPWEALNTVTMGWWPGDVSWFVGRSASGKSWSAVLCALAAWRKGFRILFISGEMTETDVAARLFAIEARKSHGLVRRGKLSILDEESFFTKLEELSQCKGIDIMETAQGASSVFIDLAIEQCKPQLVIIDSAYKFKAAAKSRDRFDNIALLADELKTYARKHNVAIVATTQLNRESTKKKKDAPGTEDIAQSDVISWNATNIFALIRNEEQRTNHQMGFFPIKIRESENTSKPIVVNWDMVTMNFDEVDEFANKTTMGPIPNAVPKWKSEKNF